MSCFGPVSVARAAGAARQYLLKEDSPAIGAGTNEPVTVETDLDGDPRIVDGIGDWKKVVDLVQ